MKKNIILICFLMLFGIILLLSLVDFKNPIIMPGNIEQNYFVLAAGIDKGTEKAYRLTVIAEKFSGEPTNASKSESKIPDIVSVEGDTVFETVRNFNKFKSKSLFWGHIKYILINEELARENILSVMDFFIRDHELRFDTSVAVVKGLSAEAFIRSGDKIEKFIPDLLDGVFHDIPKLSISKERKIADLIQCFDDPYSDATVPSISIISMMTDELSTETSSKSDSSQSGSGQNKDSTNDGNSDNKGKSDGGGTSNDKQGSQSNSSSEGSKSSTFDNGLKKTSKETLYLDLNGFATFNGTKMIGYIKDSVARGLNWAHGDVESGVIVTEDNEGDKLSFEIINSESNMKTKIVNDMPEVDIDVYFTTNLDEIMSQNNIFTEKEVNDINERLSEIVKQEIESAVKYSKDNDIDMLEIGNVIYHQHPLKWEKIETKWKEILKNIKVNVNVTSAINRTYHIRRSIGQEKYGKNNNNKTNEKGDGE